MRGADTPWGLFIKALGRGIVKFGAQGGLGVHGWLYHAMMERFGKGFLDLGWFLWGSGAGWRVAAARSAVAMGRWKGDKP